MSQFSCQGVSLPSSEEKQGRKKMNLAHAGMCGQDPCGMHLHLLLHLENVCLEVPRAALLVGYLPALACIPAGRQAGREASVLAHLFSTLTARQGMENAGAASPGNGKRRCCFSCEVPHWCACSAACSLPLSRWEWIIWQCHGNAAVLHETKEHLARVTGTTGKDGPT